MKIKTTDNGTVRYSVGDFEVVDTSGAKRSGVHEVWVYFRHKCVGHHSGALLFPEVQEMRCWNCGKLDIPKELLTIYFMMRKK